MSICDNLAKIPPLPQPIGLSIGTFDGVHRGHHTLFHTLRNKVSSHGSVVALTFTNHPSHVLRPHAPTPLLSTLPHKLQLLQGLGIDLILLVEFTAHFATRPFDLFLTELQHSLPFTHLVLGEDARFGKDRQGGPEALQALAPLLHFEVEYLAKLLWNHQPISSGRIRTAIHAAQFREASDLLGRPYSILAPLQQGNLISLPDLCLPPDGTYPISLIHHALSHNGQATVCNTTKTLALQLPPNFSPPLHTPLEMVFR